MSLPRRLVFLAGLLASALLARAHNPGLSTLKIEVEPGRLVLTLQLTPPDLDADGRASPEEIAAATLQLQRLAPVWVALSVAETQVEFVGVAPGPHAENGHVIWRATAPLPPPAGPKLGNLTLHVRQLAALETGHREFVTITRGGENLAVALLSAEKPMIEFTL